MTVAEVGKSGQGHPGVDSGTSFSSKEVTPRDGGIEEEDVAEVADIKKEIEERLDIDLDDPDVVKATTKIQAGFRGAMTRKSMKRDKQEKGESEEETIDDEEVSDEEEGESEYEDSEEEEEVGKGKNTFVLLKQLVGIMKLGAGSKMAATIKTEAENKESSDTLENGNGGVEVINGDVGVPRDKTEEGKVDEVNGDVSPVRNGNPE